MGRNTETARGRAARAVKQKLESLERAGVTHLPKAARAEPPEEDEKRVVTAPATEPETPAAPLATPGSDDPRVVAMAEIAREVAGCTRCKELARSRTQTVFGVGNPHTRLVFLGEAPGADEDAQGEPFVGRAGQLLNRIIEACTLKREEVYILNILKCRPPGNREPLPNEAANCREYLDRQLAVIEPKFICCLGAVAAKHLLDTTQSIGKLRGRLHEYSSLFGTWGGARVLCTYHPAYLLRNPNAKVPVWEDMQLLMAEMGIELPKKKG
ncbi:MAG: uracil-DNA glycosylase [Planctomycetota bacterium]|jgi:DNA polymerase